MHGAIRTSIIVPLLVLASQSGGVLAQDVQYTTTTRISLGGALGKVASFAAKLGGGSMESKETTYIKGHRMRVDGENNSTIYDVDQGRFTFIDHRAKTYTVVSLADAARVMQQAATQAHARASVSADRTTIETDSGDVDLHFNVAVDPTKERQKIDGYDAGRIFVTLEVQGKAKPKEQQEKQQPDSVELGQLVVMLDTWNSKAVPAWEALTNFRKASGQTIQRRDMEGMAQLGSVFAHDGRIKPAMRKAAAEAQKVDGMPVRSTMYFVFVAPGKKFDRALALNAGEKKDDKAASSGQKAKGLFGKALGAKLGIKKEEPEAKPAEASEQPPQATFMTAITELGDVKAVSLPASLFQPPADYKEVKPEALEGKDGGR